MTVGHREEAAGMTQEAYQLLLKRTAWTPEGTTDDAN